PQNPPTVIVPVISGNDPVTIAAENTQKTTDEKNQPTSKRSLSEILTPTHENVPIFVTPQDTPKNKKTKQDNNKITDSEMMQSITKFIDQQQTPSSLSAAQLKDLLENSYGSRDVLSLSKDYTEDTPALLELLLKIHSHTENRTLKVRCTKLRKKLQRQMECEPQSDSSDQLF
ncbi:hypothetical protein JTB14_002305, partial [Gonioctena quinquepunctata]